MMLDHVITVGDLLKMSAVALALVVVVALLVWLLRTFADAFRD